jgi:Leucine-rich repeat (LRR) protein
MIQRRLATLLLPALILGSAISLVGCPAGTGNFVFFQDAALDSAVRAAVGKPLGLLTQADALSVTEVDASGLNIQTLDGIEALRNLTVLDLRSNNVRSITPLENLVNLRVLNIGDNNVAQITAVSGLFLLEELTLSGGQMDIVDWSPLSANATNGGLGAGDVVVLPTNTTLDSEGNVLDYWESDYLTLLNQGVSVIFDEMGTTGSEGATN